MDGGLVVPAVVLGRNAHVIAERRDGLELQSPSRLAPGGVVDIVWPPDHGSDPPRRRAIVWSWRLTRVGNGGPLYRGYCRWT